MGLRGAGVGLKSAGRLHPNPLDESSRSSVPALSLRGSGTGFFRGQGFDTLLSRSPSFITEKLAYPGLHSTLSPFSPTLSHLPPLPLSSPSSTLLTAFSFPTSSTLPVLPTIDDDNPSSFTGGAGGRGFFESDGDACLSSPLTGVHETCCCCCSESTV